MPSKESGRAQAEEYRRKQVEYLFPCVGTYYEKPFVADRASGMQVWDVEGQEYLDFFGGILTVSVGHCHPEVTEPTIEQMRRLQHLSTLYINMPQVDLAVKLAEITPGRLKKCFFTNSGTEANETAILLAKLYTGQQEVIALRHGYSGRSMLAMSLSAHAGYRRGGTHILGIKHAHSGYCYRCPFGATYPGCDLRCAKDFEELIQTETSGHVAAFIAEPIQGMGGFITPPKEYFQEAVRIVRKYGGVFISDEVQTGFGRTGKWFGIENWGVEPEIMTFAKGLANGAPVGATIAWPEVADAFGGATISTFGGNPVTATAALNTLKVMEKEDIPGNAARVGAFLMDGLRALQEKYPFIGEVRGLGLMIGVELVGEKKAPAPDTAKKVLEATRRNRLLIGKGGLFGNVLRLTPPMTLARADAEEALRLLDVSLGEVADADNPG